MKQVQLSERPLLLAVAAGFGLWVLLQTLMQILWVLALGLVAIILAAALGPVAEWLRRFRVPRLGWRLPRAVAVFLVYLVGAAIVGTLGYGVGASLVDELVALVVALPEAVEQLAGNLSEWQQAVGLAGVLPSPRDIAGQVQGLTAGALGALRLGGSFAQGVAGFLFQLFFVLTLSLFLVVESEQALGFWVSLFPPANRDRARELSTRIGRSVGSWLLGQIAIATISGTVAGVGSAILGLPYPALIGLTTALLDLAPMVGPGLMAIPAFLLGLSRSPATAVAALVFFYALAQVDGNVLSPVITGRAVQLSPTLILLAVPIGFALLGTIGALVAVPVAAALQMVARSVLLPWLWSWQGTAGPGEGDPEPGSPPP